MLTSVSQVDVLISNAGLPGKTDYPPWNPNDRKATCLVCLMATSFAHR